MNLSAITQHPDLDEIGNVFAELDLEVSFAECPDLGFASVIGSRDGAVVGYAADGDAIGAVTGGKVAEFALGDGQAAAAWFREQVSS